MGRMAVEDGKWIGKAVPRLEDEALLTGNARFIDDLSPVAGLRHVAILRAPYAHAVLGAIDVGAALGVDGVTGIVTGRDLAPWLAPLASAVRAPVTYFPIAMDKVRYVGEPVAVVAAVDRYQAEDAAELIEVDYQPLPAVADPRAALADGAPLLHEAVGSNLVHQRTFRYGAPDAAFDQADLGQDWQYLLRGTFPFSFLT